MTVFRRSTNPVNPLDELADEPLALFAVIFGALVAGPALLYVYWAKAAAWALEHSVLVPAAQASLTIPATQAGLDGRRIVVGALLLIAAAAASTALVHQKRIADAKARAQGSQP